MLTKSHLNSQHSSSVKSTGFSLLCIILILIYSCIGQRESVGHIDTILIDESFKNLLNLDSIAIDFSLLPLETETESIFETVSRIEFSNRRFYISDRASNCLLVFDTMGKLDFKLSSVGRGPDGFYVISSFKIGKEHDIYVLSGDRGIVSFDSTGEYIRTLKLQASPRALTGTFTALALIGNEEFILWNGALGFDKTNFSKAYYAYRINSRGQVVNSYLPIRYPFWGTHTIFYGSEGNYLMQGLNGNDTIYRADSHGISPAYIVDFGKTKIPESLKNVPFESYLQRIYDLERKQNYSSSINSPMETEHFLYFQFRNSDTVRLAFRSKETGRVITGTFPFMKLLGWPKFNCISDNLLVGYIEPYKVHMLHKDEILSFSTMENKIVNEILKISPTNNPVLLLLKIKNF